jgi:probable HAF family extracellular repeat protein
MKSLAPCVFWVVVALAGAARGEPPRFVATPVQHPDNNAEYVAWSMNDLGQVVGVDANGSRAGWVWTPGVGVTVFPADDAQLSPRGINNAGQVAFGVPPSRWSPGTGYVRLAGTAEFPFAAARAINNAGVVVGQAYDLEGNEHAAYWPTPDNLQIIPRLPGITARSGALSINDRGDIVGLSRASGPETINDRAFLRTADGDLVNLGTLPGHNTSYAADVNNSTHVVGVSGDHHGGIFAGTGFLWTPERGLQDLQTLTGTAFYPVAINDADAIVGLTPVTDPLQPQRVVYWSPGDGLHDLESLLDASATGVNFQHVLDLNNAGQVLVSRETAERWFDYLLTPVPEPGAATATLVVLAFAATRRRVRPAAPGGARV